MPVKLRDHQVEAVAKMHNGCVLYGDVGVGKTITSLGYYFTRVCGGEINAWGSMSSPRDVYVITTAKVRDSKGFELQAAQYGIHANPELSTNGVKITVDSWNNLHKYVGTKDAFFIFDEQRVVGYGAWSRAFIKIARENEWILLSATPGDTWMDYIPVFIANGWYKHKTDFVDQHVVWTPRVKYPKVLRYRDVGTLVRRRNEVLVHMPYKRHTVRHSIDIICDYDEVAFEKAVKKRWHVFEQRPLRDIAELFSVMRRVVNSDASRLHEVTRLLSKHPKLIVFYNFDYELEALRTLVPADQLASPESIRELKQRMDSRPSEVSKTSRSKSTTGGSAASTPPGSQPEASTAIGSTPTARQRSGGQKSESPSPQKKSSTSSKASSTSRSPISRNTGFETIRGVRGYWTADDGNGEKFIPVSRMEEERWLEETSSNTSETGSSRTTPTAVENSSTTPGDTSSESDVHAGTFSVAEWNGHKHEEIPTTDRWLYLVQYRAGAEGWNCIETDAICFYSQTYSYRDWFQAHGRIDRLNTPFINLYYYYLTSRSIIDKAIRAALKVKKNFNERDLKI